MKTGSGSAASSRPAGIQPMRRLILRPSGALGFSGTARVVHWAWTTLADSGALSAHGLNSSVPRVRACAAGAHAARIRAGNNQRCRMTNSLEDSGNFLRGC
jgi:hypothetical protein